MRVIAGAYKGRRLKTPRWEGLRPTSDKMRETLFNILAPRVGGSRVLDGFAGTGALGIEALSRGATAVTFIEADRRATALIADNLAACGIGDGYSILHDDALGALRRMPTAVLFDLVLLDPPYAATGVGEVLEAAAPHLAPDGLLVLEYSTRRAPDTPPVLVAVRDVRSGASSLRFLVTRPDGQGKAED